MDFANEAGRPQPRVRVQSIEVGLTGDEGVYVNAMTLNVGQEEMLPCLRAAVEAINRRRSPTAHVPITATDGGWSGARSL